MIKFTFTFFARHSRWLAVGALLAGAMAPAVAQELDPPAVAQAKVQEWIKTRQLISEEKAAWDTEKQTLTDLNEIRRQEIEKLGEFVQAAEVRIAELSGKKEAFAQEQSDLKTWRLELESKVRQYENRLAGVIGMFPVPLREKVEEAVARLEERDPEAALQDRMRDLLQITRAFLDFQGTITVDSELREIDGQKRELKVMYLGLNRAYYVDATAKYAGYGSPTPEGWQWHEANRIASQVNLALDVHATNAPPQFVTLPVSSTQSESK